MHRFIVLDTEEQFLSVLDSLANAIWVVISRAENAKSDALHSMFSLIWANANLPGRVDFLLNFQSYVELAPAVTLTLQQLNIASQIKCGFSQVKALLADYRIELGQEAGTHRFYWKRGTLEFLGFESELHALEHILQHFSPTTINSH